MNADDTAVIADMERDAKRYRWLRDQCISPEETLSPAGVVEDCWALAKIKTPRDVDRMFDRAIKESR